MKKVSLLVGILASSMFLFGNENLAYEDTHLFGEPLDMVQNIVDFKDDFEMVKKYSSRTNHIAEKNYQVLQNITNIDLSKAVSTTLYCNYESKPSGNVISPIFVKKNNLWHLKKIPNTHKQRLNKVKQKDYPLYSSQNCIDDFRVNFENVYRRSKLRLIGREALVKGIVLTKNNKTYRAVFNLSYYSLNKYTQSGWHVSKIDLKPIKQKVVVSKKVPSKDRGFQMKEITPYMPEAHLVRVPNEKGLKLVTQKNRVTKLTQLVCDQKENYIRMVFTLDKNEQIASKFREDLNEHKYMKFELDGKKAKVKRNNCGFLLVDASQGYVVNLENLPAKITAVKYGNSKNPKQSYIDFYYEKNSILGW